MFPSMIHATAATGRKLSTVVIYISHVMFDGVMINICYII